MSNNDELRPVEAGELQMRKTFEEVSKRNISSCVKFSNDTRKIVRDLEKKLDALQKQLMSRDEKIERMNQMIINLMNK